MRLALGKVFGKVSVALQELSRTWLKPRGEKECSERCLDLLFGFHMAAELPGAATGAMLRSEQEETVDVFETVSAIALHGFP